MIIKFIKAHSQKSRRTRTVEKEQLGLYPSFLVSSEPALPRWYQQYFMWSWILRRGYFFYKAGRGRSLVSGCMTSEEIPCAFKRTQPSKQILWKWQNVVLPHLSWWFQRARSWGTLQNSRSNVVLTVDQSVQASLEWKTIRNLSDKCHRSTCPKILLWQCSLAELMAHYFKFTGFLVT